MKLSLSRDTRRERERERERERDTKQASNEQQEAIDEATKNSTSLPQPTLIDISFKIAHDLSIIPSSSPLAID